MWEVFKRKKKGREGLVAVVGEGGEGFGGGEGLAGRVLDPRGYTILLGRAGQQDIAKKNPWEREFASVFWP